MTQAITELAGPPSAPRRMTEEEFVAWTFAEEVWAEWVDGEVVVMNAVETDNSELTFFIAHLIRAFTSRYKLGKLYGEPAQVRLPRRRRSPDLIFVTTAHLDRVERMQVQGPPDLLVEVVSPESRNRDRREKFAEYQAAGVAEYWMADRPMRSFEAYSLGTGGKYGRIPEVEGAVFSALLPGLFFRPEWVWQLEYPQVPPLVRAMARGRRRLLSSSPPPASDKPVG